MALRTAGRERPESPSLRRALISFGPISDPATRQGRELDSRLRAKRNKGALFRQIIAVLDSPLRSAILSCESLCTVPPARFHLNSGTRHLALRTISEGQRKLTERVALDILCLAALRSIPL